MIRKKKSAITSSLPQEHLPLNMAKNVAFLSSFWELLIDSESEFIKCCYEVKKQII
jgi:hypothetical protein